MTKQTQIIIGIGVLLLVFGGYFIWIQNTKLFDPGDTTLSPRSIYQKIGKSCLASGGTWFNDYRECENIASTWCDSFGGVFNDCASVCRHSTDDELACTEQCVAVCKFANSQKILATPLSPTVKGATYVINNQLVTLAEATSSQGYKFLDTNTSLDLNADGQADYLVIIQNSPRANTSISYIAPVVAVNGQYRGGQAFLIGRDVAPQKTTFDGNLINVNYVGRYPWQTISDKLAVAKTKHLLFADNQLVEQKTVAPSLSAITQLAVKKFGDCLKHDCRSFKTELIDGAGGDFYVQLLYEDFGDDSVRAVKKIIKLQLAADGQWTLGEELLKHYACYPGRGSETFDSALCQ